MITERTAPNGIKWIKAGLYSVYPNGTEKPCLDCDNVILESEDCWQDEYGDIICEECMESAVISWNDDAFDERFNH